MPRPFIRAFIFAVAGAIAVVAALFAWLSFAFEPSKDEVASVKSPDGRLVARLIEMNGGATTSFGYLVVLSKADEPSKKVEVASLYGAVRNASAYGVNVRWESPNALAIEYLDAKSARVLHELVTLANAEVSVVLRSNVSDPTAPAGGMLYNLEGRRQ